MAPLDEFHNHTHRNTAYLKSKIHILDALEVQAPAMLGLDRDAFWRSSDRLLDIGAGSGEMAFYFQRKFAMVAEGLDVLAPSENKYATGSGSRKTFVPVRLFDGVSLPAANASFDIVLFSSVLHHAANKTRGLMQEAARVTRRFIVVAEDLHIPANPQIIRRNNAHDSKGIFRTLHEWYRLFRATPGVRDVHHSMMCQHLDDSRKPCYSYNVSHREFYTIFVVEV